METMYDRLGDLLNETLEAGHVKFVHLNKPEQKQQEETENTGSGEINKNKAAEEKVSVQNEEVKNSASEESKNAFQNKNNKEKPEYSSGYSSNPQIKTATIIKALTPELERAFRLLGITPAATKEEVKKAYKEKLMYYHPDKHRKNPVLEKVATDKTRQVLESYNLIIEYLEK